MRDLGTLSIFHAHGLELTLTDVRRVEIQRQDLARTRSTGRSTVFGHRGHWLAVQFEQDIPALQARIGRSAERLDTRNQYPSCGCRQRVAIEGWSVEIADRQAKEALFRE